AYAKLVLEGLVQRGVFARMPFVEPENRCIRVSAGRPEDLDLFEQALPDALADANG
ncbi:MAG: pyridoxal phosphate-dependent aminotransferase, partial [Pseudomonadota bacterium]